MPVAGLYRDDRTFFGVKDDTWIAIALWSILSYYGILSGINRIVNFFIDGTTVWDSVIIGGIWAVFILVGTAAALKKLQRKETILIVFIGLLWIFSFLLNENARQLLKTSYFKSVIIDGFCGIICIARFRDWKLFQKVGMVFVLIGIASFFANSGFVISGEIEEGYMAFSYNNLVFVIAAYWLAIRRKNVFMWVFAIIGTTMIIAVGCRGAVLCIAVFVLLEFLFNKRIHWAAKIAFFLVVMLLFLNLENMVVSFDNLLKNFDYESRTVELFLQGELESDSGRSNITDAAIKVIERKPIFGCGMAGSSYHLYTELNGYSPVGIQRVYAHNLFLDIYLDYGIIFGTLMIICLIYQLAAAFFRNRGKDSLNILFLIVALCLPKLMVSSTYLAEPTFFILLGLLLNMNDKTMNMHEKREEGDKN